ncbi:AAA-12 domain-containing protein [Fusarium sp. Ph1]|nr:AAA-12 domain-containing protein [Fusarium sp. Ph1]
MGGFDLAREIFYLELGDKFEYGDQCAASKRPGASQLESWVRRRFHETKPSPTGNIWSVFINCLHTAAKAIDTSRVNCGQAEIALTLMETLIKAHGTKFVVVSPYRATKAYLEGLIRQRLDKSTKDSALYKGLSDVQGSTADSFQGKEGGVAIFLTTVTQESGPGFVKDAQRFNVGVTRHVDFLSVVGDITTMGPVEEN